MREPNHELYMGRAIKLAANMPSMPFGAEIVERKPGRIVVEGWNKSSLDPTWHGEHGEIDAINQLVQSQGIVDCEELARYITAEPCPMCHPVERHSDGHLWLVDPLSAGEQLAADRHFGR